MNDFSMCMPEADPQAASVREAEARLTESLRSVVKLHQRQLLVTRDSLLSEVWAELVQLFSDLGYPLETIQEYRHAVGHWATVFERHCGGEVSIGYCEREPAALSWFQERLPTIASRWYGKRADAGETLSTYTQRRTCRRIASLFKLCGPADPRHKLYQHALGVLDQVPTFLEPIILAPGLVRALTPLEIRELLGWLSETHAGEIRRPSSLVGVPAWRFWRAYVLSALYEGLRPAELFRLEWRQIKRGRIEAAPCVNKKQRRWISRRLHPVCEAALEAIRTDRQYVFRWAPNLRYCERVAGDVLSRGVPEETWQLGKGLYVLRKTHITQMELLRSGGGQASAGHSSGQITTDHYLDPRQVDADIARLPEFA
jgi:integrase